MRRWLHPAGVAPDRRAPVTFAAGKEQGQGMRCMRWMLAAACAVAPMVAWAQVDLGPYLRRDSFTSLKISPTGAYYAAAAPLEDRTVLAVIRRSDKQVTAKVSGGKHSVVQDFHWVNDERVVVSMAERFGSEDEPHPTGQLYAINADGSQSRMIFGRFGLDNDGMQQRAAFLIDGLRDDDRAVLVRTYAVGADPMTRVEKLDVYNGRLTPVASAPVRSASFATDGTGEVRFAVGAGYDNVSKLYYRDRRWADWELVNDESVSGVVEWPLGLSADGRVAYFQREQASGPDAIVAFDIAARTRKELLRDADVDPYAVIHDPATDVPQGALYLHAAPRTAFFDAASPTARRQRMLEKAFPGVGVSVTSASDDGKWLVVATWSDTSPGDYYLFDTATNQASLVFSRKEWFVPARMAPTRAIELKARDGLTLHGFLTLPRGQSGPAPMVVVPHGGPYTIFDEYAFDEDAQLLAEAGYAVLRVNFRGSGNYGRAFLQAGAREWGRKMQDDLTDATRWAVAQKLADPARICIAGASYGGYAALMGVAREPDLYRCAVGYVGVYDLELLHKDRTRAGRSSRTWTDEWIGARDGLAAVSPTRLAGDIKVPVLLAAGGEDEIAPIAHSRRMEKALRDAGVPVQTLYFETEGHGFYTEPHRRAYYETLLEFLHRHIGGRKAAKG